MLRTRLLSARRLGNTQTGGKRRTSGFYSEACTLMEPAAIHRPLKSAGLFERLVRDQLITSVNATEVGGLTAKGDSTLVQQLIDGQYVDTHKLARAVSEEYGVPLINVATIASDLLPIELVPQSLVRKHRALPLYRRGNRLFIETTEPRQI